MKLSDDFDAEVYALVARIPEGRVVSYKQLARLVGFPDHARRVGRAMAAAPDELPCHRVVSSAGRTVAGWDEQRRRLEAEGIVFRRNGTVDVARYGWVWLD